MPIIYGFQSTTIWKAFILNSLAASISIVVAIYVKARYDTYKDEHGNRIREITHTSNILLTFVITFIATFAAFATLHFIFGYGGGQLAN